MTGQPTDGIAFVKMHGAGNDYVFIDGFVQTLPAEPASFARRVSDRHTGVGSDGLVYLIPPDRSSPAAAADVMMQMWNADGSEGSMCGNAARCVAMWMQHMSRCDDVCRIQMERRLLTAEILRPWCPELAAVVRIEMGPPEFPAGTAEVEFPDVRFSDGSPVRARLVAVGNPHAVIRVEELTDEIVRGLGPVIERHSRFPDRTNVEFVQRRDDGGLNVRVWERGSGETRACGSGACAAAVAFLLAEARDGSASLVVHLPGGTLTVEWDGTSAIRLAGPAEFSFRGVLA